MRPLPSYLNEKIIAKLRKKIEAGHFPEVQFEQAMTFILTDGILPASGLPAQSFLDLEDWIRATD